MLLMGKSTISTGPFSIAMSADPGLCQGRGGAWDHRRCGPSLSGRKLRHAPSRQHPLSCQLHAPAIYMLLPFARPQTRQTLRRPPRQQLLQAGLKAAGLQGNNSYSYYMPCHLFFKVFKTAVCPPSNTLKPQNPPAGLQGNNSYSYMPLPSVFHRVQDCRLPALKPPKTPKPFRRPPRQQLLQLHAPAISFSGGSRLPFARPQTPQTLPTLPQTSKATPLTATCPCHLFFRGFKTAVCRPSNPPNPSNAPAGLQGNNSYSYMPLPSVFSEASKATTLTATCPCHLSFQGVQDCRLPALKPPKPFQRLRGPPRQQLLQLHAPAICFFRVFKTAVCPPSNPPNHSNAPAGLQGNNSYSYMPLPSVFSGGSRLPFARPQTPPTPSNARAGLQGNNSYSYMPLPSLFQGVQDCRLPALKPPKPFQRFRRPPRQQLSQLHAPAICFSGGSRLPFARPQTPQTLPTLPQDSYMPLPSVFQGVQDCRLPALTLPQASKATTLTASCPCHLFFQVVQDCDSPSLMGPLLWHEPFSCLAWFPSRRVMVDVNLPKRTA